MSNTILNSDSIGKMLVLQMRAPEVLGNKITGRLVSIVDAETASVVNRDVMAVHARVYPFLDSSVPDDYRGYNYCVIETLDGKRTVLGIPWIEPDTIEVTDSMRVYVDIYPATQSTIDQVRKALSANLIEDFTITTGTKPLGGK